MLRRRTAILAVLAAFGLARPLAALEPVAGEPVAVPAVEVQDLAGNGFDLAQAVTTGDVVVLNFWATWCAPCKREMPTLAALKTQFAGQRLKVVALAMDRAAPAALEAFMAEVGVDNLEIWRDPAMATSQPMAIRGLPVTLVIDPRGREIFRHAGYADWAAPGIVTFLETLLADAG